MKQLLLFFFSVFSFLSLAQQYSFIAYSTEQGLPQSQVSSIVQDKNDYLWVGTLGGLAKFNGKEFETYTTESGILNNRVTSLNYFDNIIWVGHEGGISKIENQKILKWSLPLEFRKVKVTKIDKFKDYILISTNGAGLYLLKNNKVHPIKINGEDSQRIRDFCVVGNKVYLATRAGIFHSEDLIKWKILLGTEQLSISSIVTHQNQIYYAAYVDGLFNYNPSNAQNKQIHFGNDTLSIRTINFDSKNQCWINASEGIYVLNNGKVKYKLNEKNGLPLQTFQRIYEDKNGVIWLGSEGKGLIQFTGEQFIYYNQNSGLTSDLVLSINQDKQKHLWIGTYDKGLMQISKQNQIKSFNIGNNTVWCSMLDFEGKNWFGTGMGLVTIKNDKICDEFYIENGTPGDKITCIYKTDDNSLIIGGDEGISIYKNGKFSKITSKNIETVRSICSIGNSIYCASDKGLYKLINKQLIPDQNFKQTIFALENDGGNILYVGTEEGVYEYDGVKKNLISISKNPASNYINFLKRKDKILYIGTNNGLFVVKNISTEKKEIIRYGIGEGLVNLETNINSSMIDNQSNLWFGTASGLVRYKIRNDDEKIENPHLIIKKIFINFQEKSLEKYADTLDNEGIPNKLSLPYNQNNLTIDLQAISLTNFSGLLYSYKLGGLDRQWSPLSNNSTISYNAIPPGEYVLYAKCIDSRGKTSKIIALPIIIKQAFYKTWWFILFMISIVTIIVFYFFRYKLKREREDNERDKLVYKSRLLTLEQQSLNASMNRHFIFNSLNSIQYFINTQDRLSANKFLTNFAKLIRKNLDSSEEGNEVSLAKELERLALYLSLESMRFKDRINYKIHVDEEIETEDINIPAMILQPFVENSIIHGILPNEEKIGEINIDVTQEKQMIQIKLTDNGIGIENSIKQKNKENGDHKSQGMEITMKRIDALNQLSTDKIQLIGPFQMNIDNHSLNGTCVILKIPIKNLEN